jgi:hypothetical protein
MGFNIFVFIKIGRKKQHKNIVCVYLVLFTLKNIILHKNIKINFVYPEVWKNEHFYFGESSWFAVTVFHIFKWRRLVVFYSFK